MTNVDNKQKIKKLVYGSYFVDAPHRWADSMLPMAYAMACVEVVSKRNKEAKKIYSKIVDAWGKNKFNKISEDVFAILSVSDKERIKEAFIHPEKELLPDINKPFRNLEEIINEVIVDESLFEGEDVRELTPEEEKECEDIGEILNLIFEFIIIGFNRESDIKKRKFKVAINDDSFWLGYAIMIRTSLEHYNITLEKLRKFYKLRKYKGKIIDFHKVLTEQPMSRWHRRMTKGGNSHKLTLKNDRIFVNAAEHWYQSRVVFSSVNKYCEAQSNEKIVLDVKNIEKTIKPCDKALGYQGRIKKESD